MPTLKRSDIETAFIAMLRRVGGGYRFTAWLDSETKKNGEQSDLSKQLDADWCLALYGSDAWNNSHIVAYVGVIRFDETLRIKAEIDYLEECGDEVTPYVGTRDAKSVSSASAKVPLKSRQHKGVAEALELLKGLVDRFSKNVAQL